MPREQRKRGKKHKAKNDDVVEDTAQVASSSAIPIHDNQVDGLSDAPFGHVDPDVKAYFKTVDDQLKEWQNEGVDADVDIDLDPNERKPFWLLHVISSEFFSI